jgi:hypothetical protein
MPNRLGHVAPIGANPVTTTLDDEMPDGLSLEERLAWYDERRAAYKKQDQINREIAESKEQRWPRMSAAWRRAPKPGFFPALEKATEILGRSRNKELAQSMRDAMAAAKHMVWFHRRLVEDF